jgi:hypothetical protein
MLGIQAPPDFGTIVQQMARQFVAIMTSVLTTINVAVIDVSRLAYISVLLVGLILYSTHLDKRLGKDLIKGGVILAVLSELVFPQLVKV